MDEYEGAVIYYKDRQGNEHYDVVEGTPETLDGIGNGAKMDSGKMILRRPILTRKELNMLHLTAQRLRRGQIKLSALEL